MEFTRAPLTSDEKNILLNLIQEYRVFSHGKVGKVEAKKLQNIYFKICEI